MDSLDRLSHSLEQAVALIHSLRRENRDLARQAAAAMAAAKSDVARSDEALRIGLQERAVQAELESARQAEELEQLRRNHQAENEAWARDRDLMEQQKLGLEARLATAEAEAEVFGRKELEKALGRQTDLDELLSRREIELEESRGRVVALESALLEKESELETSKMAVMMLQVKIAESLSPEEVTRLRQEASALEAELGDLRPLKELKAVLEAEKMELRRQKKSLAAIGREREQVRARLDEIYGTLENLRLSS